jgi:hypothetical protein
VSAPPSEDAARAVIDSWLAQHAPGHPEYYLSKDEPDGWAFWILPDDRTSYVHPDLTIEWLGTEFDPDLFYAAEDA